MQESETTPHQEAVIEINGYPLTNAESMTIRVALESFAQSLSDEGLGDDEHGKKMTEAYQNNIREIRKTLYAKT